MDPTTLAILRRSLVTIANEMGITIAKAAYSPVISEGRDFTGAIFDENGHLVACGDQDLPGLLGTLEPTLQYVVETVGRERMRDGDVYACNAPHEAGTHLNDVRLIKPVWVDGKIFAFVADLGHWTDVGGAVPGSINPLAQDAYGEGLRITPIKIVENGVARRDVIDMILGNLRLPYEANGDIWAQMKALELGERRLHALVGKHGSNVVRTAFDLIQDHAEALLFAQLAEVPDGDVEFEDFIDADPLDPERRPVRVALRLAKHGSMVRFDFRSSDPQPKGGVGSPRPITQSGVYIATLNLFPGLPFNHGVIRNLHIETAPGSAVHVLFPNPVSGCAAGGFEKVIACVLGCWGKLDPNKQVGATFNLINLTLGGHDARFDRPFVMYLWNEGGFGGGPDQDASDAPGDCLFSPGSRNQPIEVHERFFPIVYKCAEILIDSAGPGKWRGCPGVLRAFELRECDAALSVFGDRHRFKPWGVAGGGSGSGQTVFVDRGLPTERELGVLVSDERVTAGSIVEMWSSGGGGHGDPMTRDIGRVLSDVQAGLVGARAAREVYGVALVCTDEDLGVWEVDEEQTALLRDKTTVD